MLSLYVKFWTERGQDGQMERQRQTDRQITLKQYTPDLLIQGHIKSQLDWQGQVRGRGAQKLFPASESHLTWSFVISFRHFPLFSR